MGRSKEKEKAGQKEGRKERGARNRARQVESGGEGITNPDTLLFEKEVDFTVTVEENPT